MGILMFKRFWDYWFPRKVLYPEVKITVEFDQLSRQDLIYIAIDWPKDMGPDKLRETFANLLFLVQNGNLYQYFQKALEKKASRFNYNTLATDVDNAIKQITATAIQQRNQNIQDEQLIFPSEVFRPRG